MSRLLSKLLRGGRIPDDLRAELTAEGLLFLEERLTGSLTYRKYRAPGRRTSSSKEPTSGAIAVSAQRLVVWVASGKNIDIPISHRLMDAIEVTVERPSRICFAYDAGRFSADRSGTVQVRLRTAQAARLADLLKPAA